MMEGLPHIVTHMHKEYNCAASSLSLCFMALGRMRVLCECAEKCSLFLMLCSCICLSTRTKRYWCPVSCSGSGAGRWEFVPGFFPCYLTLSLMLHCHESWLHQAKPHHSQAPWQCTPPCMACCVSSPTSNHCAHCRAWRPSSAGFSLYHLHWGKMTSTAQAAAHSKLTRRKHLHGGTNF